MSDSQPSPPLPNDPAARSPTGELLSPTATSGTTTPTPTTSVEPTGGAETSTGTSTGTTPAPPAVPDTYIFTPPEGQTYDKTILDAAIPVFKDLGLSQAAADKLVAFWNAQTKSISDAHLATVTAMRTAWQEATRSDPELGPRLETIKADLGRAYATLDPKLVADFKQTMDLTGVGDNPAFIKTFWKLAQSRVEGRPVAGAGPAEPGQSPNGAYTRPTPAAAMYPHLRPS